MEEYLKNYTISDRYLEFIQFPPNDWAKESAMIAAKILDTMMSSISNWRICASNSSMMIEFYIGYDYHLIECFNDRDIIVLRRVYTELSTLRESFDVGHAGMIDWIQSLNKRA